MRSLVLSVLIVTSVAAVPALAQDESGSNHFATISQNAERQFGNRNFSLRINEIVGRDGSRQKRQSIIAGVDVAPGTVIGFGLFDSAPKKGRGPDPKFDGMAKRSRKAAVGMSLRF